jgi:hypothetical protein
MTAHALIEEARADGLELCSNGDKLRLSGPVEVVERWKPRIVASKPEIMAFLKSAPRSTWWLIHHLDGAPVEVWTSPPATYAQIMASRPDAVAAQPLHQAAPEPITACSTCIHATYRGGCGVPVAAGLSAQDGVIRYHDDSGSDCPVWLASMPPDLEARILAMAERWHYSGDDLATALFGARSDPDGWRRVVETDEQTRGGA